MSLTVGQMSYNGVTLGPGGLAQIVNVSGLTGLPTNRNGDVNKPNAQGMLGGYDFMGTRTITINAEVTATGGNYMPVNLESVRAAFQMSEVATGGVNPTASQVLAFNFGQGGSGSVGVTRQVSGRVRKFDAPVDITFGGGSFQYGKAKVAIQIECIDPYIYDANIQTASAGLIVPTGGLVFPVTFPVTFGSQTGGIITAVNLGSVPGPCRLTVVGPCTNPRIEQQSSGVTLQFNETLAADDTLVIDTFWGSAVLDDEVSRTNTLASNSYIPQFLMEPGTNTIGFYSDDSPATDATLTVEWSNTWA